MCTCLQGERALLGMQLDCNPWHVSVACWQHAELRTCMAVELYTSPSILSLPHANQALRASAASVCCLACAPGAGLCTRRAAQLRRLGSTAHRPDRCGAQCRSVSTQEWQPLLQFLESKQARAVPYFVFWSHAARDNMCRYFLHDALSESRGLMTSRLSLHKPGCVHPDEPASLAQLKCTHWCACRCGATRVAAQCHSMLTVVS